MISHLDHIVLTVSDLARAVDFYKTVLKMDVLTLEEGRSGVRFGNQHIHFQVLGEELRNHAMEGAGDVCLVTEWSMDEVLNHLTACNVNLLEGPVSRVGTLGPMQSVYFNDPDNHLIEVSVYEQSDTV